MKYSFIIPVFNGEEYIERCIRSVTNQNTNIRYEIIIVNDGSTDSTELIVNKLLLEYSNIIRYVKQKKQGPSIARNNGILKSKGEYIIFVDSDDEVYRGFFDNLEKTLYNNSYDIIKTKVKCIENKKYDNRFEVPIINKKTGIEALNIFCDSNKIFATTWSYVFKRDFMIKERMFFKPLTTHEDYLLIPIIISKAQSIISTSWYGYKYIKRENSLSTSNNDDSEIVRINDFINNTYELISYFKRCKNLDSQKICRYFYQKMETKISHVNLNVKSNMDLVILNKIQKIMNNILKIANINDLPVNYAQIIKKVKDESKKIFKANLVSLILGGSCGKCNPIIGWSDIDLYVILKKYNPCEVRKLNNVINNYCIHVGVTFYSLREIENGIIDNKTKIMLYEKQNFNVNPTLYGYYPFEKIKYERIIQNDKDNLANILHEFRRMYIKILDSKTSIDKKYIKKLILLLKCYFNIKGKFLYGYETVIIEFLKIYNKEEEKSTKLYFFDIMDALNDIQKSRKKIIDFSNKVLEFVVKEMEDFKNEKKN